MFTTTSYAAAVEHTATGELVEMKVSATTEARAREILEAVLPASAGFSIRMLLPIADNIQITL